MSLLSQQPNHPTTSCGAYFKIVSLLLSQSKYPPTLLGAPSKVVRTFLEQSKSPFTSVGPFLKDSNPKPLQSNFPLIMPRGTSNLPFFTKFLRTPRETPPSQSYLPVSSL